MTRAQSKSLLPVIRAWSEDKDIQVRIKPGGDWHAFEGEYANFQNENWEWRVKPDELKCPQCGYNAELDDELSKRQGEDMLICPQCAKMYTRQGLTGRRYY